MSAVSPNECFLWRPLVVLHLYMKEEKIQFWTEHVSDPSKKTPSNKTRENYLEEPDSHPIRRFNAKNAYAERCSTRVFDAVVASNILPPHRPYDHKIEIKPGREDTLGYSLLRQQSTAELQATKQYLIDNLNRA